MTTAVTTPDEPDGAPRLPVLDILRGIAILGILFMNINDMGRSLWASQTDFKALGWTPLDQGAWWLREVLANGTARALLEMLFGVGMVILTDRATARLGDRTMAPGRFRRVMGRMFGPGVVLRRYYARNLVLFVFGLIHIFILLWPGDILHTYGLAAMVAFLFRRLGPRGLLIVGLVLATLSLVAPAAYLQLKVYPERAAQDAAIAREHAGTPLTDADRKLIAARATSDAERAKSRAEDQQRIATEDRARSATTGTAATWAQAQVRTLLFFWGFFGGFFIEWAWVWEAAGTMLIGAALYKMGIIQGRRGTAFYVRLTLAGYLIGGTMRAVGAWHEAYGVPGPNLGWNHQEFGRLAMTLGHVGLVNLLLTTPAGARLLRPFDAAGKTALSIYVAQTLVCLWVLYPPWGFGLYGHQGWAAMMLTALAVNAVLLWGATVWVRHFAIAPVEWAWRSIIARRRLPFRLRAPVAGGAGAPLPA